MTRILIADDHAIVRQGLKQILADAPDLTVVGEAQNGVEAIRMLREQPYDLLLLDIAMPGKNGVEVLKQIKREMPQLPVLILSMYPAEQYAVRLIKAGAASYLTKESAPEQLIDAVRAVSQGKRYIGADVADLLAKAIGRDTDQPRHQDLSDREFEILRLIASGNTVTEIAQALVLSVKTVSTYRTRLLEKMNIKNNSELTLYAIKNHLIE